MIDISDDKMLELASQDRPITREELGIAAPQTNDGFQILNEGFFGNKKPKYNKKSKAYKTVFNDLMRHNLFKGIYDAKNGRKDFMYGIATVMECIALGVSYECYDMFQNEWTKNIIASEEKLKFLF